MAVSVDSLTFDCRDPRAVAPFWAEVLGYEVVEIDEEGADLRDPTGAGWRIVFLVVPEGKSVKNRLHLDLRPATSMAEEKARVAALGAREFRYVSEGGSFWTVMLDPEGNEFCVLRGPQDGWAPEERDV
ncbi:MAG TPA: VOC family protein [Actinomycetota bacterium]|nr:VOC family protein [Actinomycetota bacterium]